MTNRNRYLLMLIIGMSTFSLFCSQTGPQESALEEAGLVEIERGSPEEAASRAFEVWVDVPYQNQRFEILENDGTFAPVKVVAEFRRTVDSTWMEEESTVDCRKIGAEWRCDQSFSFSLTVSQITRLTRAPELTRVAIWQNTEGQIVFFSHSGIFAVGADGTGPTPILDNQVSSLGWMGWDILPDSIYLIASGKRETQEVDFFVINVETGELSNITLESDLNPKYPVWSPDGKWIAFISHHYSGQDLYVMTADGSARILLTRGWNAGLRWGGIVWSPNSSQIAFESDIHGRSEISVISVDGTKEAQLTNNPAADLWPAWSPDGTQIAFVSERDGNSEVYVMNADGTKEAQLTNSPAADLWPAWSPDGTQIAFVSERDGNSEVYVMNADGTKEAQLTNNPAADLWPAWSPDGTQIAFVSERDGNSEIYVMNADGSKVMRLTHFGGSIQIMSWPRWFLRP